MRRQSSRFSKFVIDKKIILIGATTSGRNAIFVCSYKRDSARFTFSTYVSTFCHGQEYAIDIVVGRVSLIIVTLLFPSRSLRNCAYLYEHSVTIIRPKRVNRDAGNAFESTFIDFTRITDTTVPAIFLLRKLKYRRLVFSIKQTRESWVPL